MDVEIAEVKDSKNFDLYFNTFLLLGWGSDDHDQSLFTIGFKSLDRHCHRHHCAKQVCASP